METIGKYEILDKIGSGGFAIVYKGYDPFIKRPVAIKVCFSRDEATRRRFYREAEIAGRLVHRNITTVYDFGLHEEMPYLVEEYLSGEDLAQLIRRQEPTHIEEKLAYLLQIGDGIGFAHSQGVIHRDIKPSNVRVLDDGRVKIMDFGTAKLAGAESNLTQTGMTMGTIAYLAPERLRGHTANPASDLFSFGVLAYEMLTFSRPFDDTNIPGLIDRVLKEATPPLLSRAPECPAELAAVVERCLAKDPEDRWSSCAELNEALARAHRPRPVGRSTQVEETVSTDSDVLAGLLTRARSHVDRGRRDRALVLLEEALEVDATSSEAKALLEQCAVPSKLPPEPTDEVAAADDPRRAEAVGSIARLLERGRLIAAHDALRFAVHLFGDFDAEFNAVRAAILRAVRQATTDVRGGRSAPSPEHHRCARALGQRRSAIPRHG